MNPLPGYQLIGSLGKQKKRKFGSVYEVRSIRSGDCCVLKIQNKDPQKNQSTSPFLNEAQYNFSTEGLPQVIELIDTKDYLGLVLKKKNGIPIDEYFLTLKKKDRLPFIDAFVRKLNELFKVIHSEGIIHCDIKTSNILIEQKQDDFDVHLIDFGMAINSREVVKRSTLFPLGYAAPELLLNQLDLVNPSTDYFSLGILIWRLFVGELPLNHPNPSIYTNLQLTHPLPEHSKLPKGLLELLLQMTSKPAFKTSPNRMQIEKVRLLIEQAQQARENSVVQFISTISSVRYKWYQF